MSGLNDGFRFFGKSEIALPRTRQNIDFPENFQKRYFFSFLYDLEENIPNRQFLIFLEFSGFSGPPGKISGFLNRLLTCTSLVTPAHFFPYDEV